MKKGDFESPFFVGILMIKLGVLKFCDVHFLSLSLYLRFRCINIVNQTPSAFQETWPKLSFLTSQVNMYFCQIKLKLNL